MIIEVFDSGGNDVTLHAVIEHPPIQYITPAPRVVQTEPQWATCKCGISGIFIGDDGGPYQKAFHQRHQHCSELRKT